MGRREEFGRKWEKTASDLQFAEKHGYTAASKKLRAELNKVEQDWSNWKQKGGKR